MRQANKGQSKEEDIKHLEGVLPRSRLLEGCKYYKFGVGFTCKAKDVGLDAYVECLQRDSFLCSFSLSYAHKYYCTSRSRVFMARELHM
jgi:hypothetical protein